MPGVTRGLPAIIVVAALLTACTSAAAPTSAPSGPLASPTAVATRTSDGTLPKPELASLKVGGTIGEVGQFPTKLAQMLGIYEKYGLHVDISIFNSEGNATQALYANAIDVTSVGSSAALNSRLTDAPMKMVTIGKVKVVDGLYCAKDIKTATDVKGKAIGVSSLGGTPHASALLALESLKLSAKDVTFQTVGTESIRVAALKSGAVACAPVGMSLKPDLDALGLNLLVDLSKTDLQYPSTGMAVPDAFLKKNPNTTLVLVASLLEAQNYMWTNPNETAALWASFSQSDPAKALVLVKNVPDQQNRTLRWKDEAFVFMQQIAAIVTPGIMTVDPTTAFDRSFLKTLEEIGFYRKIGVPLG